MINENIDNIPPRIDFVDGERTCAIFSDGSTIDVTIVGDIDYCYKLGTWVHDVAPEFGDIFRHAVKHLKKFNYNCPSLKKCGLSFHELIDDITPSEPIEDAVYGRFNASGYEAPSYIPNTFIATCSPNTHLGTYDGRCLIYEDKHYGITPFNIYMVSSATIVGDGVVSVKITDDHGAERTVITNNGVIL